MSSESERKSPGELKAQAKMNLAQAAQTETYVSITEKNWRALIQSQQTQIDMLSTMMNTMEMLATWSDLSDMQQEQLDKLTSPGYAPETSAADSDGGLDLDGELPITGWEYERGILEEALLGGGTNQKQPEEDYSSFSYPNNPAGDLGTDSAYLAADVMNIIDNDTHAEDCTTNKKPHHEHKNTLGGM